MQIMDMLPESILIDLPCVSIPTMYLFFMVKLKNVRNHSDGVGHDVFVQLFIYVITFV